MPPSPENGCFLEPAGPVAVAESSPCSGLSPLDGPMLRLAGRPFAPGESSLISPAGESFKASLALGPTPSSTTSGSATAASFCSLESAACSTAGSSKSRRALPPTRLLSDPGSPWGSSTAPLSSGTVGCSLAALNVRTESSVATAGCGASGQLGSSSLPSSSSGTTTGSGCPTAGSGAAASTTAGASCTFAGSEVADTSFTTGPWSSAAGASSAAAMGRGSSAVVLPAASEGPLFPFKGAGASALSSLGPAAFACAPLPEAAAVAAFAVG
mmetsp:Transcript_11262/g.31949  ORF Transcript_11262/g.31949 Transcript_11262/m.31949 type:complete len:270 (+) Transcript_11262:695-1504(+)